MGDRSGLLGAVQAGALAAALCSGRPVPAVELDLAPERANAVIFGPIEARYVRVSILATAGGQPCVDELEIYAAAGADADALAADPNVNLALASRGSRATASSCLPGHAIHQIEYLNDGRYGNSRSWISAGEEGEWAQIELAQPAKIGKLVFSRDREGRFRDRMPTAVEIRVSPDGASWIKVADVKQKGGPPPGPRGAARAVLPAAIPDPAGIPCSDSSDVTNLLRHAFAAEAASWWAMDRSVDPIERVFSQMADMLGRLARGGLEVAAERSELAALRDRREALRATAAEEADGLRALLFDARTAKRQLMFRDPELKPLERILFAKRHPLLPSHNYSDMYDSRFQGGGGLYVLTIPGRNGRLTPSAARLEPLFETNDGIARDAVLDYDAKTVYFALRPAGRPGQAYWHLMRMNADGSDCRPITDGPFHDYYPCVLPDGDLAFVSTRCRARFLCWKPQTMVLFRMHPDGSGLRPLSHANLSEWGPSVMRDGRILWTRSEYQDKGADYGHTLWAMRPDGAHPELIFGNNTTHCLMNGREVPGSAEICATLVSHFGDFNGPIALVTPARDGPFAQNGPNVLTPDHRGIGNGGRFRDPCPVSCNYILVSHNPSQRFGLYVIDRYGNREILYMDARLGSMCPTPLRPEVRPPVLAANAPSVEPVGRFLVTDVYEGLGPGVKRGSVKYIRVCEEVRSGLEESPDGRLREVYEDFMNHYASPMEAGGPAGWPTYVAKAVHGVAPVNADGAAYFEAPAGRVLYFQALDAEYNEVQRMRSVVQLQPGEVRSCTGCHEDRLRSPPTRRLKLGAKPDALRPPPWSTEAFDYPRVVQPILDRRCVRCHDANHPRRIDLTGAQDAQKVPASYRSLLKGGWVHYFNCGWHERHSKAEPLTFGTAKSRLWAALAEKHRDRDVGLTADESQAIKCWTDLNCPLWPNYVHRSQRPVLACATPTLGPAEAAGPAPASAPPKPAAPRAAVPGLDEPRGVDALPPLDL
jgi:hypothetical protein